jgi:hypothetical protein
VTTLPRPPAQPGAPTPPPSPEAIARSIAALATRLSELMIKETALLIAGRTREGAALIQEKTDLARAYAGRWGQLKAHGAGLNEIPQSVRDALHLQVSRLSIVAAENEKALRVMQNATDRVLGIITRAIRQHYAARVGYTRGKPSVRHAPSLLGVALDRSL